MRDLTNMAPSLIPGTGNLDTPIDPGFESTLASTDGAIVTSSVKLSKPIN
jgi:hypothetical protein